MATKKTTSKKSATTRKKATVKKSTRKAASKQSKQLWSIYDYVPAWLVSVIAAVLAYIAFSLAIDSGSLIHYALGFYFFYATIHHGHAAVQHKTSNDKKAKTGAARRAR